MKLKNKKTGEIKEVQPITIGGFRSLAELNEEWEDYEEPKEHWCVTMYGGITRIKDDEEPIDDLIEIGNYFNSKEDAYDARNKLKAWKRLKDKGFRFHDWKEGTTYCLEYEWEGVRLHEIEDDLELLFGGEE